MPARSTPLRGGRRAQPASPQALGALLVGAAAIGFAPIFVRLSDAGPTATAFWRLALALPALWLWAASEPRPPSKPPANTAWWIVAAGVFFAVDLALWHWSIRLTSVANATLFANFAVIFVVVFAWIFQREVIGARFLVALVIAFAGTVLLVGANVRLGSQTLLGDALGIGTAVFYGAYLVVVKILRGALSTARIMAGSALGSAPVLAAAAVLSGDSFFPGSVGGWLAVIGLALLSHLAGQSLIAYALAHLRASFSSLALLFQPVVAAVAAWALLGETLTPWQLLGGAAVLCGVALARPREGEADAPGTIKNPKS